MTLPASGPLSLSAVNTELQLSSTATISLNDASVRTLFAVPSGAISMSSGYGKAYTIPGNSGILTTGSSFTLPSTSGLTISVLVIGSGGGGGGGSNRRTNSGFTTGAGGGGAGGNQYALNVPVTPGQSVSYFIGAAGGAGALRDGVFTSGSNGTTGDGCSATVSSVLYASASGGSGGLVSPNATGGAAGGSAGAGIQTITPTAGSNAGSGTTIGGLGARGYTINTTVGLPLASIIGYGATGTAGSNGTGIPCVPGTIYGAGGTGGGTAQGDEQNNTNAQASGGTVGAVFIWWGY